MELNDIINTWYRLASRERSTLVRTATSFSSSLLFGWPLTLYIRRAIAIWLATETRSDGLLVNQRSLTTIDVLPGKIKLTLPLLTSSKNMASGIFTAGIGAVFPTSIT